MVDFVKKKIVEKLARFTKDLKPSDISLSFLSGKGHLSNLELNAQFISNALQLPPWVAVSRVVCDTIRARVPFTNLSTDPVNFYIGQVLIEISTCTNTTSSTADAGSLKLLDKLGGNPSKYGLIEKVIDGMRVEIRSILVFLKDPFFHAQLEMTDILIQSTSFNWEVVPLNKSRVRIEDEDSVINYKVCSWSSLKIEGWSTVSGELSGNNNQLRLIVGATKIHVTFKRKVSDSSLMHSRISMHLGDLIWILTQSQLRAVSRLIQSLIDAAVRTQRLKRVEEESDSDKESLCSFESVSIDKSFQTPPNKQQKTKGNVKSQETRKSKTQAVLNRISQYHKGKLNLPIYEVIQNSFHLRTGKVDLQLCDDISGIELGESNDVQGSLLIQVYQLIVDLYLDQPACVERAHWNKANDIIGWNSRWSRKLVLKASKTQFVDVPSVSLSHLRERGVVIRCGDFSVGSLRSGSGCKQQGKGSRSKEPTLPIITSDKKTFNIPDDVHNPAFQVGVSLYFYPEKYGNKFLVPRPNILIYLSPVHVNLHQESCLWLVEFVHGVIRTVNVELALNARDEGKTFIEERKAQSIEVHQLPGIDMKFKILFTKVTIPLPDAADDGRPKALQLETSAIKAKNCPLNELLDNSHFSEALRVLKGGWVLSSQDSHQFPHVQGDLRALPLRLQELLQQKVRPGRKRGESSSGDSSSGNVSSMGLAPEEANLEMATIEGWHVSTSCVHLAFASNYTHKATLYTTTFIDDFPIHLWVFLPPSSIDASLPSSRPSLSTSNSTDPKFSFIAHAPSEIKLELERLHFLFLMRLKDSFSIFRESLMKFLDPDAISPDIKETLKTHSHSSDDSSHATHPITISGCVVLKHVEASILLPSLQTSQISQATNTDPTENVSMARLVTDVKDIYGEVNTLSNEDSAKLLNEADATLVLPHTSPPRISPASSQTSLNIPTTSSQNAGMSISSSPTGSQVSLPVMLETETLKKSRLPDLIYASTSSLQITGHPPARSYSAVELHPKDTKTQVHTVLMDASSKPLEDPVKHDVEINVGPSIKSSTEDDFVMVQSLSNSDSHISRIPCRAPPLQPLVLAEGGTKTLSNTRVTVSANKTFEKGSTSSLTSSLLSTELPGSATTQTSVKSSLRQPKSPTSLRTVSPQYVVHAQIRHVYILPSIKAEEITARLSVDTLSLRELSTKEHEGMKVMFQKNKSVELPPPSPTPSIKARMEMGKQVERLYPNRSGKEDVIVIAKVEGLDVSLLLPNITNLKDFFDDEFQDYTPVPLHLKVNGTRAVLVEDLAHGADHAQSITLEIDQFEVHRGNELVEGVDVFSEASECVLARSNSGGGGGGGGGDIVGSSQTIVSQETDDKLLQSFYEFITVFEAHVQHHGHVHLPQPQHICDLLQELQASLKSSHSPPPIYSEVVSTLPYSHLHSSIKRSSNELLHLRRENEQLRLTQRECERLSAQLQESQVVIDKQQTDLLMVTEECKRTKEQLISYKQVMEKQQEHIEKLLTENFDLQKQT